MLNKLVAAEVAFRNETLTKQRMQV
ncbi:uncharacterized protein METZ01_LOCUS499481 [marine metagenome]|uniref:Uncharacterized protein n=1 Tax=marine metagenome TaxID=408172 RepID=A0A383DQ37_9ZZZZ